MESKFLAGVVLVFYLAFSAAESVGWQERRDSGDHKKVLRGDRGDHWKREGGQRIRNHAEEMAVLYDVLLESVEKDATLPAPEITRMYDRVWAYRTMAGAPSGDSTVDLLTLTGSPSTPAGWIDLTYLLMYLGEFELAEQAFNRGATVLNETRRWTLQFIIDEGLGRTLDTAAARLIGQFNRNPDAIFQAYPDFRRRCRVPFGHSYIREMSRVGRPGEKLRPPADPALDEILRRMDVLDTQLNRFRPDREPRVTAWSIDSAEGMPGQTLILRRPRMKAREHFSWKSPWIEQGTKSFNTVESGSDHAIYDFKNKFAWMRHYVTIPIDLEYGPAKLHVETGVIPIRIVSRPAPPIIHNAPSLAAPGQWMAMHVLQLVLSEKDPHPRDIEIILDQSGRRWNMDWFHSPEAGRGYLAYMVCRLPKDAQEGRATLKVVQRGVASEPLELCIVDGYYFPDEYSPLDPESNSAAAGESVKVWASRQTFPPSGPADTFKFLVRFRDGLVMSWNPERAPSPSDPDRLGIWRIPAEWPTGRAELRAAYLQGDVWHLLSDRAEYLDILSKPAAPKFNARFNSKDPYRLNDTVILNPGTLWIGGEGFVKGEPYVVFVRWEGGGELKLENPAAANGAWFVELPAGSSQPDVVRMARVANGVVGHFAEQRVLPWHDYGTSDAQTALGRAAAKWLMEVCPLIDSDHPLSLPDLLEKLGLRQLPTSPYGGPWKYFPNPAARNYTFLAFDHEETLKFQYNFAGRNSPVVEYDDIGESYDDADELGESKDNLLWVIPWDEGGFGNVVADAAREVTGADVAVYNPTGLCGNFPKGRISKAMIEEALPYENEIILLEMSGVDLAAFFQEATTPNRFLYVSGLRIQVHPPEKPSDSATVTLVGEQGQAMTMDRTYALAVNDYLVKRSLYSALGRAKSKKATGIIDRESVTRYVKKNRPLTRPEPRWTWDRRQD